MDSRTIREIGGEIWGEIRVEKEARKAQNDPVFDSLSHDVEHVILDLTMAVLARHAGKTIINDEDLPVEPRPMPEHYPLN